MTLLETMIQSYDFNRSRTLATLDRIEKMDDANAVLAWRPGVGRAHAAWQMMHIAITEDIFATERLAPDRAPKHSDLWERFRGGSAPDEQIPELGEIKSTLLECRENLLETINNLDESNLDIVLESVQDRGWSVRTMIHILSWHESHHQGQIHMALNLYDAQSSNRS